MAVPVTGALDLWTKAVDSLDPQVVACLEPAKTGIQDIIAAVLEVAQDKREESLKKRWRLLRRGKQEIVVRDVLEKIVFYIAKFKDVGDNAVQVDPVHVALPWAAVRFILQAAVNYTEVEREILAGLELITRLLAVFREIEKIYLGADALVELQDALVEAYTAILETLSEAVAYLSESKKVRGLKAPFRLTGGENTRRLFSKEQEVLRYTNLVDGKRLLSVTKSADRTAELSVITEKAVEEQKYKAILDWLSRTRYLDHHEDQRKLRSPGTGTWLLQHVDYTSWQQQSSSSTLLVHGIPGCGKTILSSFLIDESSSTPAHTQAPLAFFYCSASEAESDRRDAASVLRSLVRQLTAAVSRYPKVHSAVLAAYDRKTEEAKLHGFELSQPQVHDCENLILDALEDNPAVLVIDALDEMYDPHVLLDSLQSISTKSRNVLKIMITARDGLLTHRTDPVTHKIRVTLDENQPDVERFVAQKLDEIALQRSLSQDMRDKLMQDLVSGAGEMFQWAKLQLSQLQTINHFAVEQDLSERLASFAVSTLDELYGAIFDVVLRCGGVTREMAIHAFSWLLYAQEPLAVDAFLEVTSKAAGWDRPSSDDLVSICRGFIYIDSHSGIVRFAHQSARTFLQAQSLFEPHQAQTLMIRSCLRIFKEPPADELTSLQPTQRPYDYALLYSGDHLSALNSNLVPRTTAQGLETFLFDGADTGLYTKIWLESVDATFDMLSRAHPRKRAMESIISNSCSPIFPVCAFNMIYVLECRSWPLAYDWDQRNKHGHTALYVAAHFGHVAVVRFLLDQHADPNIMCGRLGTALQCAAYHGHYEVVQALLKRGADSNLQGHFESAVHAACRGNRDDVAVALLEHGFEMKTQDQYDSIEAEVAKAGLVQALAKLQRHPLHSITMSSRTAELATSLVISGETNGLRYLLGKSPVADVIPPGSLAVSALHGHDKMTAFLMEQGFDIDEIGELGSPLRCASIHGHNHICIMLLDQGADINGNGRFGGALHAAAMKGHLHTAKLLLSSGAEVNICGGYYGTPLQAAAYHGHPELVHLLLAAKANVHATGFSKDAVHAAVEGGRHDIVQLFFDGGYQPSRPIHYPSPCFRERPQGRRPLPRNVLRDSSPGKHHGKDVGFGRSVALHEPAHLDPLISAQHGKAYVSMKAKNQHSKDDNYLMEAAAALGHREIVATILADPQHCGEGTSAPRPALKAACRHGQLGVVEEMLRAEYRLDLDLRESLREAALHGHGEVVRTLLDNLTAQGIIFDHFEDALVSSIPDSPAIFKETMISMKRRLSQPDRHHLLLKCLPEVSGVGWHEIVEAIIGELPAVSSEGLIAAFERACDAGKAIVASVLYSSNTPTPMSSSQLIRRTRLAAQDGHTELLRFLLSKSVEVGFGDHFDEMIMLAAGDGLLETMIVLLTWERSGIPEDCEILDRALNVGAHNGHEEVCAYLLSRGTDPSKAVVVPRRDDLTVSRVRTRYDIHTWRRRDTTQLQVSDSEPGEQYFYPDPLGEATRPNRHAVLSCLIGYQRFTCKASGHDAISSLYYEEAWPTQDQATQTRTLEALLDSAVDFDETQWTELICTASKFCLPEALEMVLNSSNRPRCSLVSGLELAVVRDRSTVVSTSKQAPCLRSTRLLA